MLNKQYESVVRWFRRQFSKLAITSLVDNRLQPNKMYFERSKKLQVQIQNNFLRKFNFLPEICFSLLKSVLESDVNLLQTTRVNT